VGATAYALLAIGFALYATFNNVAPNCDDILSPHAILLALRAGLTFPGLPLWGPLAAGQSGALAWLARYVLPGVFPAVIGGWLAYGQQRGAWRLALGWLLVVLLALTYIGGTVVTLVLARFSACQ
jgi:hypothetical protein